jgi:4-amino-4-deoxy-L-arabinose transferase-like glycosyltransferase
VFAPSALVLAFMRAPRRWLLFGKPPAVSPAADAPESVRREWAIREGLAFVFAWFVAMFVLFSLSPTKQGVYILPLYPSAALMVAEVLLETVTQPHTRLGKSVSAAAVLFAAVFTIGGVAVPIAFPRLPQVSETEIGQGFAASLGLGLGLVALVTAYLLFRGRAGAAVAALVALAYGSQVAVHVYVLPRMDAVKSARPLCQKAVSKMKPEDGWAIFGNLKLKVAYVFYTGRRAEVLDDPYVKESAGDEELQSKKAEAVRKFFSSSRRVFCVMRESELEHAERAAGRHLPVVAEDAVGRKRMVVVSNAP